MCRVPLLLCLTAAAVSVSGCRAFRSAEARSDNTLVLPAQTREALDAIRESRRLTAACTRAAGIIVSRHPGIAPEAVALAVIDFTDPGRPRLGQLRGYEGREASELAALPLAIELMRQRAMGHLTEHQVAGPVAEMLINGDVDAINAAVDALTDTETGDTLIGPALDLFLQNRRRVDRSLQAQGIFGTSVAHHLTPQSPQGREAQAAERLLPSTNTITAADTARLLYLVGTGNIISRVGAAQLYGTMQRPAGSELVNSRLPQDLPPETRVWGLAAWTRRANHGACLLALPTGERLAVAALTEMDNDEPALVRDLAEELVQQLLDEGD